MSDLYADLGVDKAATAADIKRAYRKAAKKAHPDGGGSPEAFAAVSKALKVLTDPRARKTYDETGRVEEPGPDDAEAKILQTVMQVVQAVIASAEGRGRDARHIDVIDQACQQLTAAIGQMRANQRAEQAKAKKLRDLAKRFKAKTARGKNLIAPLLDAQAGEHDRNAAASVANLETFEAAIALLRDHEFRVDAPPPYSPHSPGLGAWSILTRDAFQSG